MIRFALGFVGGIAFSFVYGCYLLATKETSTSGGPHVYLRWKNEGTATPTTTGSPRSLYH